MYSIGGFSFKHSTDVPQLGRLQSWPNISPEQWTGKVTVFQYNQNAKWGLYYIYRLEVTLMLHLTTIITPTAAALAIISLLLLLFLLTYKKNSSEC